MGLSGALALGWSEPRAGQQILGECRAQQVGVTPLKACMRAPARRRPTRPHSPKPYTPVCGWWRLTPATLI